MAGFGGEAGADWSNNRRGWQGFGRRFGGWFCFGLFGGGFSSGGFCRGRFCRCWLSRRGFGGGWFCRRSFCRCRFFCGRCCGFFNRFWRGCFGRFCCWGVGCWLCWCWCCFLVRRLGCWWFSRGRGFGHRCFICGFFRCFGLGRVGCGFGTGTGIHIIGQGRFLLLGGVGVPCVLSAAVFAVLFHLTIKMFSPQGDRLLIPIEYLNLFLHTNRGETQLEPVAGFWGTVLFCVPQYGDVKRYPHVFICKSQTWKQI